MKLIATIQVTAQVGEDSWTRETVAYEISKKETAEELFARIMADVEGATCRDNCIKITSVKEAADEWHTENKNRA